MGRPSFNTKAESDNRNRAQKNPDTNRQKSFVDKQLAADMKAAKRQLILDQQAQEQQEQVIEEANSADPVEPVMDEAQMAQNGVRFSNHSLDTDPVPVHRYSPALDVACAIAGVPYGMVAVAGRGTDIRSHEIKLDGKDISGFLPRIHTVAERGVWERWNREQNDLEAIAIRRIERRLAKYRKSRDAAA